MGTAPIGRMLDWGESIAEPSKCCRVCGHPRSWHDMGKKCFGNPKYKGICSMRCQKFKPVNY